MVAVAGDPHHPRSFYFGACAGGIWKTVDGGLYWRCVSDCFLSSATIGALAVAPSDPNVVYAGTGEKEASEISAVIAGEMEAIAGNLAEAEVSRARAQLKVSLLMGMERPGTRAEQIAGQLFALGRVQSAAEIVAVLDAIDAATVKRFAVKVMQGASPTIAALGPVKKLEAHSTFARRFGSTLADAAE